MQQLAPRRDEHASIVSASTRCPLPRAVIGLDPAARAGSPGRLPDGSPAHRARRPEAVRLADGGLEILDDAGHVLYRMPAGGLYFEPVYEPLAGATTIAEIEACQPPLISDDELAWLRRRGPAAAHQHGPGDRGADGVSACTRARSVRVAGSASWTDLAGEPKLAEALLQRLADAALANLARYLDAVGEYIDIMQVGDDLGTQSGPLFSPKMYRALDQAVPAAGLAVHQGTQRPAACSCTAAARHLRADPRPDRGRRRHPQPGADLRPRHGPGPAQDASSART